MHAIKHSELREMSAQSDRLEHCYDDDFGIGVRSLLNFSAGDLIDRFEGQIEEHVSKHSLQIAPGQHISQTRFVGFLSHGCDPNCVLDMAAKQLFAKRDIIAGDLLRIDYAATEDTLYHEFSCSCGADNCRGWITGRLAQTTT